MDIATLSLVHAIFAQRGIRQAARSTGRPVSSVSAALKRFESEVAAPLVRREGGSFTPTLEARNRMADLADAERAIRTLIGFDVDVVPSITLTALARFVTVARNGSIRGGATILGLGQPQLSRQMAGVERDLGQTLLVRSSDGIICTKHGLAAIDIVEDLLDVWQRLSLASGDRFRRASATWRFGSIMPLGPESEVARMLAALTAEWNGARPRQPLFISSTTADELIAGLKSRRFDVVMLDIDTVPSEFDGHLIARSPLALTGHPTILLKDADIRDMLCRYPIAVPSLRSGLRQQAEQFITETLGERDRHRPTIVEVDSIPVILNLVMRHGYLSILPESSAARVLHPPAMRRLDSRYRQSLSLAWQKNALSRQAAEAMLQLMTAAESYSPPKPVST